MPRGDRTGPRGEGPMTGRAAGYCAGYEVPGFANVLPRGGFGAGRGFGRGGGQGFGRGGGRGFRGGYPVQPGFRGVADYEAIAGQLEFLQEQLADLEQRLQDVKKAAPLSKSDQAIANSLYTDAKKPAAGETNNE